MASLAVPGPAGCSPGASDSGRQPSARRARAAPPNGRVKRIDVKAQKDPVLTIANFLAIKKHILTRGDRQTYCNRYNSNPHFAFQRVDLYLNPESGQANINCDPKLSDFNQLVIKTRTGKYYHVTVDPKRRRLVVQTHHQARSPTSPRDEARRILKRVLSQIPSSAPAPRLR